jgi:outer membrane protein assembly factor BamB
MWPAILVLTMFWVAYAVVARVEMPYLYRFMFGAGVPLLVILICTIWWWTNRRIPLKTRVYGFLAVVGCGALASIFSDPSVGPFGMVTGAAPIVLTALVLWMLLSKKAPVMVRRVGTIAIMLLGFGHFTLIRVNGVNGDLQSSWQWRWAPTAEELFLAQRSALGKPAATSERTVDTLTEGDWPDFRGAARDGVVSHVSIDPDWKAHPPKLLWQQRIGPAWSSVIVIGNRLFTQEQRGEQETVVCYDTDSGAQIWNHEDAVRFQDQVAGPGPRATPTFANGRIYALGAKGILNCLVAVSGEKIWSRDIKEDSGAKEPMWGFSSSPLVISGSVIVYGGGASKNLLAYDAETGKPAWKAVAGTSSYSSPQAATLAGKSQVLMLSDGGLMGFDPENGDMLWEYGKLPGAPLAPQPHVVGEGQVVVSSISGQGLSTVELTCGNNKWEPKEQWASNSMKPEFPDFVVHQGFAYGFDGAIFCCADLASGERKWKGGRYGRGQVVLLAEQGLLLVMSERGEIVLLSATPDKHQELGRFQALNGKSWSHPVVVRNRLFARNAEEIACYELALEPGSSDGSEPPSAE